MGSEARDNPDNKTYFDRSVWQHAKSPAQGIADAVAIGLQADEVYVVIPSQGELSSGRYPVDRRIVSQKPSSSPTNPLELFTLQGGVVTLHGSALSLPLYFNDITKARLPGQLATTLAARGVRSFGLFPIRNGRETLGLVACIYTRSFHRWRSDEVAAFNTLHHAVPAARQRVATIIKPQAKPVEGQRSIEERLSQYQQVAQQGNLILVTTDTTFRITDLFGNSEALLGIPASAALGDKAIWDRIVDSSDLQILRRRIVRLRTERGELKQEMRIVHQRTGEKRWLLLRALPQISPTTGELLGWQGFGVDVTDRRTAEEAYLDQNRRLEALFEVARSLQGYHDPASVTFIGLRAMLRATQGECGYACFVNKESGALEVVAARGLSEKYLAHIETVLSGPSLLRDAVERQAGLLVDDLQAHPRAQQSLAKLEGIHSAIIVPMISDSHPIGALVLFKRSIASFTDADFDLASAAVAQLALAVRQAESIEEQRRHSNSLSSLYKVSRELTKYRGSVDFAEAVIPILKSEFALKRGWIGLLNDQGTCLVGQAGFGPGISRSRGSVQVQISTAHTIMQRILSNKGLQHITNPSDLSPEPILELFAGATSLMVIPMSTLGRVLGVVVLEPLTESSLASTDRHRLLATMANEMATALLAGKFDTKMAEALKMRMASLLASGVAHNFNNLLQAILGQVSLIDMQTPASSPVRTATKTITDAAQRGAALVSQLLSFASKGSARRIPTSVSQLLRDSESSYAALLGHSISLNLELQEGSGTLAHIDPTQFQEAMSKILANAREAIGGNPDGEVTISVHSAIVRSGELGPEVSPGTYVRVDIEDNGTGMSPEQQERCFEPFFTTKNADSATGVGLSGSGLGLAAAYAIIKDHDGIIAVHSSPGDGAVFSIYLPVTVESKDRVLLESSVDVVPSTDAPGVLLLGIETGVQSFLTKTLESLGYRARAVFDARQTHEVLRKEPAKWGTVLLDAEGLGGRCEATCQEIASTHPWIHVLCACSSAKEHEEAHKSAGVQPDPRVHHIEKPYTVWGLESALKRFDPSTSEVG